MKHGWENIPNWECLFVHRERRLFLSVYVDDIKLAGKKQNIDPMCKVLNEEVDLGEPTSLIDHENLGFTQRQCEISKDIVDIYRTKFESRISAGEQKSFHTLRIFIFLHGLMIWKVMQRNVWSDVVSWRTKRLNNSTKYLLHALMTIILKKKNWILQENCQTYPLKLFWNACTWHVMEDLIFCGQWTNLHDRLQNGPQPVTNDWIVWYLTSITHVNTNNIVVLVTLQDNARWDCSRTPWRSIGTCRTKFVRTPTCWSLVGKAIRESSYGTQMWKVPNWECMFVHRKQGLFCQYTVNDIKMAGKKHNMAPMWKKIVKLVKSLLGWSSIQTGRTWINWRTIKSLLTSCTKMLVSATNRKTRHSVVGQQTCSIVPQVRRIQQAQQGRAGLGRSGHSVQSAWSSRCGSSREYASSIMSRRACNVLQNQPVQRVRQV